MRAAQLCDVKAGYRQIMQPAASDTADMKMYKLRLRGSVACIDSMMNDVTNVNLIRQSLRLRALRLIIRLSLKLCQVYLTISITLQTGIHRRRFSLCTCMVEITKEMET